MVANVTSGEQSDRDRVDQVRSLFDHRANYLDRRQLDIRLRTETAARLVEGKDYKNILDIGCGDGSISTPLLNAGNRLTLLDISTAMLSLARSRVAPDLLSRVTFVNQDFIDAPFEEKAFDLVICVGVLAHVASPSKVIAKLASMLKPAGTLILECTDGFHFLGRINRFHNGLAWIFRPPSYKLNVLSGGEILAMAEKEGLKRTSEFRYAVPMVLPGLNRLLPTATVYRMTRTLFGDVRHNHNRWLGNQIIFSFIHP
jgi:2-polyprenyl-3-methyl-5-hydroxy-6-metoxy-1,4-benzoquinol methylase